MQKIQKITLIGLIACLFSLSVMAKPQVGDDALNQLGKDLNGEQLDLANYQGRVLLISFWATWCSYCLKELPILEGIQKRVGTDKLTVIAINKQEHKKVVEAVHKAFQDADIQLTISHDQRGFAAKLWGVGGIPHLVMVDHLGKIAHIHVGYSQDSLPDLVDEINVLLEAQAQYQSAPPKT